MFTGIIEALGEVKCSGSRLVVTGWSGDFEEGESISVNGVCLTLVSSDHGLAFDLSEETLARTTLGKLGVGDMVNLERAMQLHDRFGGHIVQGHVDGLAQVLAIDPLDGSTKMVIKATDPRFLADKGSIALDGISLTITNPQGAEFDVHLIPHTLENTNLRFRSVGDQMNVEYDILAKHVDRLLQFKT